MGLVVDGVEGRDQVERLTDLQLCHVSHFEMSIAQSLLRDFGVGRSHAFRGEVVAGEAALRIRLGLLPELR